MQFQEAFAFSCVISPGSKPIPKRRAYVQATGNSIDIAARGGTYSITREMLKCFFDLSAVAAARVLGICLTVLKNMRKWMRVDRWPFDLVNKGMFEMTREQIVELRLRMIARLEAGGVEVRNYHGVLPMLKEAATLGLGFKAISARGPVAGSSGKQSKPRPVGNSSGTPVRVVTAFQRPQAKRRVNWVSQGAVYLTDDGPVALESAAEKASAPAEEKEPEEPLRPLICPYAYARDCVTPAWVEPAYPPEPEVADGVAAFWPVMEDPKRIWMQELIYRSLAPNRSAPAIASEQRVPPVSAAEMKYVSGFLAD